MDRYAACASARDVYAVSARFTNRLEKFMFPDAMPMGGIRISPTNEVIIIPTVPGLLYNAANN
jgi:hypothetical protein